MLGTSCLLHEHTRLVPLEAVPLHPVSRAGPTGGPSVWLCANSAAQVWDLVARIEDHAAGRAHDTARAVLAHSPRRWRADFPGAERVVAYRMWLKYGDAYLRGSLDDLVRAWWPDGRPRLPDWPNANDLTAVAQWPARLRKRIGQL